MKRAARFKTGSVVFDKRRKTWNFLWWEGTRRHSRLIGTLQQYPTKGAAQWAAQQFHQSMENPKPNVVAVPTVNTLVEQYRVEKMPQRYSTRRSYEVWLKHYILPVWGARPLTDVQARSVELWLQSLELS